MWCKVLPVLRNRLSWLYAVIITTQESAQGCVSTGTTLMWWALSALLLEINLSAKNGGGGRAVPPRPTGSDSPAYYRVTQIDWKQSHVFRHSQDGSPFFFFLFVAFLPLCTDAALCTLFKNPDFFSSVCLDKVNKLWEGIKVWKKILLCFDITKKISKPFFSKQNFSENLNFTYLWVFGYDFSKILGIFGEIGDQISWLLFKLF